ncbi:MAG: M23 family metallopeptidase [Anaerolineales bacterium]
MGDRTPIDQRAKKRNTNPWGNCLIQSGFLAASLAAFLVLVSACTLYLAGKAPASAGPGSPVLTLVYGSKNQPETGDENPKFATPVTDLQVNSKENTLPAQAGENSDAAGFSLSGVVFFDMDGNGIRTENEPGIRSVRVCIQNPLGFDCTPSGQGGSYHMNGLQGGPVKLYIEDPSEQPESQFRYLVFSYGYTVVPGYYINGRRVAEQRLPDTRVSPIQEPFEVEINADLTLDLALTQGYLTDPFSCQDRERIAETHWYDLEPATGQVRNYKGETAMEYGSEGRTADGHQAVDWGNSNRNVIGILVRAAAPGIVAFAGEDITLHGNCRMVTLAHPDTGHRTGYVHLDTILVVDGQELKRGQIIGTLGDSCTEWPHLHFTFNPGWDPENQNWSNKDPFRDTQDPASFTWWTVDNQPVCIDFSE